MSNYTLYTMAISILRNVWFLKTKFWFFFKKKINATKIQNFTDIQKTVIYIIELSVTNMCTKFQANISILCCAMNQKPSNGNDVTFWNSIFGVPIVVRQNKRYFLEFWDETGQDRCLWKKIFVFKIWPFLTGTSSKKVKHTPRSNVKMSVTIEFYASNDP